jgi:regulatory protein
MNSAEDEQLFTWVRHYCAYRERCIREVRQKLQSKGILGDLAEEQIGHLQQAGYLDEERYARLFAGGHFRQKQWGRRKIEAALRFKGVPAPLIRKALAALSAADYRQTLGRLAEKAWRHYAAPSPAARWAKVKASLLRKGFEPELMTDIRQRLLAAEKKTGSGGKNQ